MLSNEILDQIEARVKVAGEQWRWAPVYPVEALELVKMARRYAWLRESNSWSLLFADPLKFDGGGWARLGSRWVGPQFDVAVEESMKEEG